MDSPMRRDITRRSMIQRSAAIPALAAAAPFLAINASALGEERPGNAISVRTPENVQQTDILYDAASYTAFPHVVRLNDGELLIAFRQAPREERVRHTHPRSVITVMRSYDLGQTWDAKHATQLAAGGGQELALIALGEGKVGGLLAMHEVVPVSEAKRAKLAHLHPHEYPFGGVGGFWCWSDNDGLSWLLHHTVLFAPRMQPCAPPIRLKSGTLLAPVYGNLGNDRFASSLVYRSEDQGKTWSSHTVMAQGTPETRAYHEPALLEIEPDHILAMHRIGDPRDGRNGLFWRNESQDGGKTWSKPEETDILSGACPRLLKLSDGRILLTYGRRREPFGLYARLSNDGGKTWSKTSWLLRNAPNGDQGYSSSIEIKPGRIFTACYAQNDQKVTGITGTFWDLPKD